MKRVIQRAGPPAAENPPDAARAQLHRILASPLFAGSDRLSRFLRFTVDQTLLGQGEMLKEYFLGVEVFDRPESYDPRTDPSCASKPGGYGPNSRRTTKP